MTIKEVQLIIEAYAEEKKQEQKQLRVQTYNQSYLTSVFVGMILNGKHLPSYENVFKEDAPTSVSKQDVEASILEDKMRDFARQANKKFKK